MVPKMGLEDDWPKLANPFPGAEFVEVVPNAPKGFPRTPDPGRSLGLAKLPKRPLDCPKLFVEESFQGVVPFLLGERPWSGSFELVKIVELDER